jgi:hypothetical protein
MTRESIIKKIDKLLKLATSPNENEAMAAMAKAGELMSEHDLAIEDVTGASDDNDLVKIMVKSKYRRTTNWEAHLAWSVVKGFDCRMIRTKCNYDGSTYNFLGHRQDVEMASHYFHFLRDEILRQSKGKGATMNLNSFRLGMANQLGLRLAKMSEARKQANEAAGCTDLVVVKGKEVDAFVDREHPKVSDAKIRYASAASFLRGTAAADKVGLHRPITNNCRRISA